MRTRERIVTAADRLIYEQGFSHTSFGSVAEAVGISRGNFYHHFPTKDTLLQAVIASRIERTGAMLENWQAADDDPLLRVLSFVRVVVANAHDIQNFGCPVGTLTSELSKLDHPLRADAVAVFSLFRDWLAEQFRALGAGAEADDWALHVLTASQGIATLSSAFRDQQDTAREVARLETTLRTRFPGR